MTTALITGVTGQDGSYLAEHLLTKGYHVVGIVRRTSHDSYERIGHLLDRLEVVPADLLDQHSLTQVVGQTKPDEVYNLAAQSFVPTSWSQPVLTVITSYSIHYTKLYEMDFIRTSFGDCNQSRKEW